MEVQKSKIPYRAAKGFISFFMLFSAYFSYTHAADLRALGFPDYFRIELVIAKILGAMILLLPFTPVRVKEWIYAGFIITMASALVAHISSGDPLPRIAFVAADLVVVLLCIRFVSGKDLPHNPIKKQS